MSDELDEFLRQAAERRRMRHQEKAGRPPIAAPAPQPPPPPPVRREAEPVRTLQPSVSDDAYERASVPRTAPNPPPVPEARRLQTQFEKPAATPPPPAKENRSARKKQPAAQPRKLGDSSPLTSSLSLQSSIAEEESSYSQARPQSAGNSVNAQSIAELLRNPNAVPLGAILVLGEVLKRPWE